ncbi:hypothetical protein VN97_g10816 [Penicillium thymicola]|uniref:Uncharacterized protein n=1 Tax=Penicillium thymicola TaxID=293382 RepID=A0AAI9T8I6_PENTH|nr:hypothetical protein VN97_g10816 [Penicillium thymicola]
MGLIKTGLTLAGTYGLIKAASKCVLQIFKSSMLSALSHSHISSIRAAAEREDKKQNGQNTSQKQYYPNHNPQMDHMNGNQMNNPHVQPSYPLNEPRSDHGSDVYEHSPQAQSRSIQQQSRGYTRTMENPPPYYQSHPCEIQGDGKIGSAQGYYKSK